MQVQKQNYQRMLENILEKHAGERPRLLLHACCAPCSSYVLEYLSHYFEITIFFYNPNIATEEEYVKRGAELKRLILEMGLEGIRVVVPEYDHSVFLKAAQGLEREPERGARCEQCFRLRLAATAAYGAKVSGIEGGFDYICTTLTISPLKDAALLNLIGEQVAEQYGQAYLPSDFKKKGGYQRSVALSHEYNLYRQNYCGCEFSRAEAQKRSHTT